MFLLPVVNTLQYRSPQSKEGSTEAMLKGQDAISCMKLNKFKVLVSYILINNRFIHKSGFATLLSTALNIYLKPNTNIPDK